MSEMKNSKESTSYSDPITLNGIDKMLSEKILKVYSVFKSSQQQNLLSNCFLSFNGGKDCTVLLHLIKSYLSNHQNDLGKNNLRIIYIQPNNPFKEIEEFVDLCESTYNVKIERHQGKLRSVLGEICEKNTNLKAVIMGSRRSDPYCEHLQTFHPTDPGWPKLIRISPLLDWTTKDIWDYIRCNKLSYCCLYDEGYTSIGDITNTRKNPYLKFVDAKSGEVEYRPAYELFDDTLERAGRE